MPDTKPLFEYQTDVLQELLRHGVRPTGHTRPELVREFVRDLYRLEIRALRSRLLRKEFPRAEYSARVEALRNKYPVLALLPQQFVIARPSNAG